MPLTQKILQIINSLPQGQPFVSSKFLPYGSRANVDQSLVRLVKRGEIARIARGIYVRPKHNRLVGNVLPGPLEIAQTLAHATGSVVQVNGAEAARQLGLSTQMPTHPVFLTNGHTRHIQLDNLEITLKHVAHRKLVGAGTKAGLAITALWYLGKAQVNPKTIEIVKKQLSKNEYRSFKNASGTMPAWLSDTIRRYEDCLSSRTETRNRPTRKLGLK